MYICLRVVQCPVGELRLFRSFRKVKGVDEKYIYNKFHINQLYPSHSAITYFIYILCLV